MYRIYRHKKFLEFHFREDLFYAKIQNFFKSPNFGGICSYILIEGGGGLLYLKMPNFKISFILGRYPPIISGPTPKFKIWLSIFSSPRSGVSEKVCYAHVGQKLRGEISIYVVNISHFQSCHYSNIEAFTAESCPAVFTK
jgi:hypothetical protein